MNELRIAAAARTVLGPRSAKSLLLTERLASRVVLDKTAAARGRGPLDALGGELSGIHLPESNGALGRMARDLGAGDFIADDLPINCQSRKGGGGGELEVAFQLSSGAVRKVARTKAMFLLAAGTLASDPHLASHQWWLFFAYITLFCLSLLLWVVCNPKTAPGLAAQQHPGKLLAAAYLLRVVTLAFQAWCGLIPLNHLGAAVPAVLQVSREVTTRPLANC